MKKLLFVLALLCGSAFAQGSFYQLSPAYPNATLRVCPIGTANPCPSPSSIFADSALSQPVTQPVQLGPTGNFGFYVSSGQYLIQIGQPYNAGFVISLGGAGGSGTVNANNGNVGAVATYAAAGGSTTVGPTTSLTNPSAGELDLGSAGVGGSLKIFGGTSGSNTFSAAGNGTELDTTAVTFHIGIGSYGCNGGSTCGLAAATTLNLGGGGGTWSISSTGSGNLVAATGKGQHINTQAAANDLAGTCTLASGSCTITFTTAYTSAPACVAVPSTTGTFTTGATLKVAPTTSNVVFTSTTGTDSAVIDYICMGNPN